MPEKFKDAINIPVAIPVWGLVCFLAGGIFYAGAVLNKLDTLLDNYGKTEKQVATMYERQIGGLAAINNLQSVTQNHETRLSNIERELRK